MSDENLPAKESAEESVGVVMYCRSWCPDCARARRWLDDRGIPYIEIDVEQNPQDRMHAESLNDGRLHTPTFVVGDEVCVDFRPERLEDMIGID